jgi:hypothetical protein
MVSRVRVSGPRRHVSVLFRDREMTSQPERDAPVATLERRIARAALVIAVVAVAVQTTLHLVATLVFDPSSGIPWSFDADHENTPFMWASAVATFGAAFAVALIALVRNSDLPRLVGLAALLAYLSLDDVLSLHEQLGLELGERLLDDVRGGFVIRTWVLAYLPLLALAAALLLRTSRERNASGGLVPLGLLLLVLAVAFEVVGLVTTWIADEATTWPDSIQVALEEGAELAGWILVAGGLAAGLIGEIAEALTARAARAEDRPTSNVRPTEHEQTLSK